MTPLGAFHSVNDSTPTGTRSKQTFLPCSRLQANIMQAMPRLRTREEYNLPRRFAKQAWIQTKDSKIRIQNKSYRSGGHDSSSDHNERCSQHGGRLAARCNGRNTESRSYIFNLSLENLGTRIYVPSFASSISQTRGMRQRSWLRRYSPSRKEGHWPDSR
jgi:hypothetical protein